MARYLTGDATLPVEPGPKIIAHVCNDIGGWGRGFVMAISKRWPAPEQAYRDWYAQRKSNDFELGAVQFVKVEPDLWIANMIGQHDIHPRADIPPIRYDAVANCLQQLAEFATRKGASIHMPRIGCGLAGGSWDLIEPLILEHCENRGVEVFVYDFN